MARRHELVFSLNAGGVDREALGRVDLERMRLTGEHPVSNWLPRVLGSASLRPGLQSLSSLSAATRPVPFIRDSDTTALLAFSNLTMTVFDKTGTPIQVSNASTTITNPTFTSGGGGWTDVSDTGDGNDGSATLGVSGSVVLFATKWRAAACEQSVSVSGGDQSTAHTLRIVVTRGPVFLRVGTSSGGEEVLSEIRLLTGTHKITFTPGAATVYIRFRSEDTVVRVIQSCRFEHTALGGAGNLTLPTPWLTADLPYLSWDQSADVLFVGDGTYQPRRIERRGEKSWSIVLYETRNGPFQTPSTDKIAFTPSAYLGNGTLTSNVPYFKPSHVGCLFELTQNIQQVLDQLHAAGQTTDYITVNGLFSSTITFDDRNFGYTLTYSGGAVMTIALERSTDLEASVWTQVTSFTGSASATYNDEQSNLTCHYRLRVTSYTSGYCDILLSYGSAPTTGQIRIRGYTSATSVDYEVVKPLGGTIPTRSWRGPYWSDDLGWPRVPCFRDDRLHWFLGDRDYASIVDDFDNYDDSVEGDAGPLIRTVGSGAAEGVRWAVDADRFIVGTSGFAASIQASDLGEVVTPTSFTVRVGPTLGASFVPPAQVDDIMIMTDRSRTRLYDLYVPDGSAKLKSSDVSRLNTRAVRAGVKAMATQRKPDTRVYIVLDDGTCVVLTYERDEKVVAFTTLETDGTFEDVCVLPDNDQDDVYFVVSRNGGRYLERLAPEAEQESVSTCALLDGYKVLTGSISSITGASHLNGKTVSVWADGQRRADVTISAGAAALGATYSRVVYGLSYDAEFLSAKLAYAAQLGTAVGQIKSVRRVGLLLTNSCLDGIRVGRNADSTDPLPDIIDGAARTDYQFFTSYDHDLMPIASDWEVDGRFYIKTTSADGPVTLLGVVLDIETRDGAEQNNGQ